MRAKRVDMAWVGYYLVNGQMATPRRQVMMTAPAERTRCQLVGLRDRMIAQAPRPRPTVTVTTEAGGSESEIGLARLIHPPTPRPRGGRLNLEPSWLFCVWVALATLIIIRWLSGVNL